MSDKLIPLVVLGGLALACVGLGRLAHRLLGRPFGYGSSLTGLLVNALLGNAALVLVLGACFHLGCTAGQLRWPLMVLAPLLAIVGAHDLTRTLFQPGTRRALALCALGVVVVTGFLYYSVAVGSVPFYVNDSPTYTISARWLQDHPFTTPVVRERGLMATMEVGAYQDHKLRMGATFLLASCQSVLPGTETFLLYLACLCWGTLLNLAAVYLLARWGLGFSSTWSAGVGLLAAVTFNSLYFSALHAFYPQQFGTAYMAFFLALLSRCAIPTLQTKGQAVALGLTAAAQVSHYSELLPVIAVVGAGTAVWYAVAAWRGRRLPSYGMFAALAVAATLILGNVEWLRATTALQAQAKALVGGHVGWPAVNFWGLALGFFSNFELQSQPLLWPTQVLIGAASVAFLIGVVRGLVKRRLSVALMLGLLVFAGLAVYYYHAPNPFLPGEQSHTWALFKLSNWVYPVLLPVICAGWFPWMLRGRGRGWRFGLVAAGFLAWTAVEVTYIQSHKAYQLQYLYGSNHLPSTWNKLKARLDDLQVRTVYGVTASRDMYPDHFLSYLVYPRKFLNSGPNVTLGSRAKEMPPGEALPAGATPVFWGNTPFPVRGVNLPGRLIALDPASPHVVALLSSDNQPTTATETEQRWQKGPYSTTFLVWSPHAGQAVFTRTEAIAVGLSAVGPLPESRAVVLNWEKATTITCEVPAGYSRLDIQLDEEAAKAKPNVNLGVWQAAFANGHVPPTDLSGKAWEDVQGGSPVGPRRVQRFMLQRSTQALNFGSDIVPFTAVCLAGLGTLLPGRRRKAASTQPVASAPEIALFFPNQKKVA